MAKIRAKSGSANLLDAASSNTFDVLKMADLASVSIDRDWQLDPGRVKLSDNNSY